MVICFSHVSACRHQLPRPYLEGVLNGWAAIDRPVESEVRDELLYLAMKKMILNLHGLEQHAIDTGNSPGIVI